MTVLTEFFPARSLLRSFRKACRHRQALVCAVALIHALLLGAAEARAADAGGASALRAVDSITIMPVAYPAGQTDDDRAERFDSLYGKLDVYIHKALLRKFALKGYVLDKPRNWAPPARWTVEYLKPMSPRQLAELAPERAGHVAYLFIERLESSNQIVHSSANVRVSAIILDRATGNTVWQRSRDGEFSEHILQIFKPIGMLLTPDKHAAIEDAFAKLFDDLPEKPFE